MSEGSTQLAGRDFEDLRRGDSFISQGRTITEADLVSFSALTGDRHPVHTDATWALRSRFGARVAHGMMLLSYAVGLAPFDPERVVALRGLDEVTFRRPVRIGDTIRLRGEVEDLKEIDRGLGLVTFSWRVLNQDGELAARARVKALWQRRPRAETPEGEPVAEPDVSEVFI
jgi:3-hydroxybutyryl-CoA dehydratase